MAWVRNDHLIMAHGRWKEAWPCPVLCDWETFLGEKYFPALGDRQKGSSWDQIKWKINDKGAKRIEMLITSPHYKTILRAMAVKYMEEIL